MAWISGPLGMAYLIPGMARLQEHYSTPGSNLLTLSDQEGAALDSGETLLTALETFLLKTLKALKVTKHQC